MDDVFVLVARPWGVGLAVRERGADGVDAGHEFLPLLDFLQNMCAHPRHDAHVDGDVGAIADLDPKLRERRVKRPDAKRDHIHRPTAHAAVEFLGKNLPHLVGFHPVVGRASLVFPARADEGAVFNTSDIAKGRAGEERVRALLLVQAGERSGIDELLAKAVVFFLRAIAPDDVGRLGEFGDRLNPVGEFFVGGH